MSSSPALPRPVIIDTDPGVDDALALLFAAASPELEVLAITTVSGNVGLEQATENARRIVPVAWRGAPAPPIYRGLSGGLETAVSVHGADGLGGVTRLRTVDGREVYPAAAPLAEGDAVDTILRLARSRPGEVTLITLGPLTNLAAAIRRDRQGIRLLREVVIMGGAFRQSGNVTPVAEFNIYADAEAAAAVCRSGLPMRWVPVDLTERCVMGRAALHRLAKEPRARFARDICGVYFEYHHAGFGEWACFLHDPIAVAAAAWPELFPTVALSVDVETEGRLTRGMTVADFRPPAYSPRVEPNARVCLEAGCEAIVGRILRRFGTGGAA